MDVKTIFLNDNNDETIWYNQKNLLRWFKVYGVQTKGIHQSF